MKQHSSSQIRSQKTNILLLLSTILGTGTGLLSIYAAEAGANEIYACDGMKIMHDIVYI